MPNEPDLRNTFGPSGASTAAAKLGGLLPARSNPDPVEFEPEPEPDPQRDEAADVQAQRDEPRPAPAASRSKARTTSGAKTEPTSASRSAKSAKQFLTFVLPEVKARAAQRQEETGESNAEIVFAAIDDTHTRLPQLIALRHEKPSKPGSLFPGRKLDRTDGRDGVTREIWTYRATPAERAVIDNLGKECGAGSRSELVSVALEAFFDVTT